MNVRLIASVGALVAAFIAGASITHIYDTNRYLKEKNAELEAVNEQHRREIDDFEKANSRLASDLHRVDALATDRLRQLETYKHRLAKSEAGNCSASIELAIEGERLLGEADGYLRTLMK